ncbi:MAG: AsmA-like C-terminal region-containing protein [Candidatus Hydrogenedentota bacterium]
MKKRIIIYFSIICSIAIIITGINILLSRLLSKDAVQSQLEKILNRKIIINDLKINILTGIHLNGLEIFNPDESKWVSCEDFILDYSLLPSLYRRKLIITEIYLKKPYAKLIRGQDGVWDFSYLISKEKKKEGLLKLDIMRTKIEDGDFEINDRYLNIRFRCQGLNISASNVFQAESGDFEISLFKLNEKEIELETKGNFIIKGKKIKKLILKELYFKNLYLPELVNILTLYSDISLPFKCESGTLNADIKMLDLAKENIKGNGKIDLFGVSCVDTDGFYWRANVLSSQFDIDYSISDNKNHIELKKLDLNYNGIPASISGYGNIKDKLTEYNINISSELNLALLMEIMPQRLKPYIPLISITGNSKLVLQIKCDNNKTAYSLYGDLKNVGFDDLRKVNPLPSLKNLNGSIEYKDDQLVLNKVSCFVAGINILKIDGTIKNFKRPYLDINLQTGEIHTDKLFELLKSYEIDVPEDISITGRSSKAELKFVGYPDDISDLSGFIESEDIAVSIPDLPFIIRNIKGRINFTRDTLITDNLSVNLDNFTLKLNTVIKNYLKEPVIEKLTIISENEEIGNLVTLVSKYNKSYVPKETKLSGNIALLKVDLQGELKPPFDKLEYSGTTKLNNIQLSHPSLRGDIKNIKGGLCFDKNRLFFKDISGLWKESQILINGELKDFATPSPSANLQIKSGLISLLSLNEILKEYKKDLLPEGTYLAGMIKDVNLSVNGLLKSPELRGSLQLVGAEITYPLYPFPLKNIYGSAKFDKKKIGLIITSASIDNMKFSSTISVSHYNTTPDYKVELGSQDIEFGKLINYLPEATKKIFDGLKIQGKSGINLKLLGKIKNLSYSVKIMPRGNTLEYPPLFPQPIRDIMGQITIEPEYIFSSLNLTYGNSKISINGGIENKKNLALKNIPVSLKIESPKIYGEDIINVLEKSKVLPEGLYFSGVGSVNLKLFGALGKPALDGDINLNNMELKYPIIKEPLKSVSGNLHFKDYSISSDNLQAYLGESKIGISGSVEDIYKFNIKADINSKNIDISKLLDILNISKETRDNLLITGLFSTNARLRGSGTDISITGDIQSDNLNYRKANFTDIIADYTYKDKKVSVDSFKGSVIGGLLAGKVKADLSKNTPDYEVTASIKKADLGKLFNMFGNKGMGSRGEIYGEIDVSGLVGNLNSLEGGGKSCIENVELKGLPTVDGLAACLNSIINLISSAAHFSEETKEQLIAILISRVLKTRQAVSGLFDANNTSRFDVIKADYKIKNGLVRSNNVYAVNKDLSITGKIEIGFNESLDCNLKVQLQDAGLTKIEDPAMREFLREEPIPIILTGTISAPNFHKEEVGKKFLDAYLKRGYYKQKAKERESADTQIVTPSLPIPSSGDDTIETRPRKISKEELLFDILQDVIKDKLKK